MDITRPFSGIGRFSIALFVLGTCVFAAILFYVIAGGTLEPKGSAHANWPLVGVFWASVAAMAIGFIGVIADGRSRS